MIFAAPVIFGQLKREPRDIPMERTTQVTNAVVATSITLWGIATGLSYEVLLAGFAGGLVSLSFLPPMGIWRRIWTPVTATLTAGYTAPIAAHYLSSLLSDLDMLALLVFSAFCLGLAAQFLIPIALKRAQKKVATVGEPQL